ncbi:DUF4236 domain-containing protein [Spirochaeta africana]|uniref:DUF4236 domain-containing protein n=1 Tax=Spirochaeta africana (strain ATCC 700263 / DSM 8902 / Z-7692) TaxID=889378 RepID=H9UHE9_SPIAZ|nr:DUF4236 domain-containing protein [Spirochaeta africana]AFG36942.1 hypothetical protein Spiaf_0850 [Spirochaeta africana DSM 8902]
MRYRKRISLGKGLRLNLSKSGLSVTGGIPGLSVNAGRQGAYLNTGIPGTGLYDRHKLGAGQTARAGQTSRADRGGRGGRAGRADRTSPGGAGPGAGGSGRTGSGRSAAGSRDTHDGSLTLKIHLDERGRPVYADESGEPVRDPSLLRGLRRDAGVQATVQELYRNTVVEHEQELAAWRGFNTVAPAIPGREHWLAQRRSLRQQQYTPRPFQDEAPTAAAVLPDLEAAARRAVGGILQVLAPWVIQRRRQEWVDARLSAELARQHQEYTLAKAAHEAAERDKAQRLNARFAREYQQRSQRLEAELRGDQDVIEEDLESLLESLPLPGDCAVDFTYIQTQGCIGLDIDLPDMSQLPAKTARILASGKLSIKDLPTAKRRRIYRDMTTGLSLYLAAHAFCLSPAVREVLVSAYTQRVDPATGTPADCYLLSVRIDRERLQSIRLAQADPVAVICSLAEHRLRLMHDNTLKEIEPLQI